MTLEDNDEVMKSKGNSDDESLQAKFIRDMRNVMKESILLEVEQDMIEYRETLTGFASTPYTKEAISDDEGPPGYEDPSEDTTFKVPISETPEGQLSRLLEDISVAHRTDPEMPNINTYIPPKNPSLYGFGAMGTGPSTPEVPSDMVTIWCEYLPIKTPLTIFTPTHKHWHVATTFSVGVTDGSKWWNQPGFYKLILALAREKMSAEFPLEVLSKAMCFSNVTCKFASYRTIDGYEGKLIEPSIYTVSSDAFNNELEGYESRPEPIKNGQHGFNSFSMKLAFEIHYRDPDYRNLPSQKHQAEFLLSIDKIRHATINPLLILARILDTYESYKDKRDKDDARKFVRINAQEVIDYIEPIWTHKPLVSTFNNSKDMGLKRRPRKPRTNQGEPKEPTTPQNQILKSPRQDEEFKQPQPPPPPPRQDDHEKSKQIPKLMDLKFDEIPPHGTDKSRRRRRRPTQAQINADDDEDYSDSEYPPEDRYEIVTRRYQTDEDRFYERFDRMDARRRPIRRSPIPKTVLRIQRSKSESRRAELRADSRPIRRTSDRSHREWSRPYSNRT